MAASAGNPPYPTNLVEGVGKVGGPGSGRKPVGVCSQGHDMTDPDNVQLVRRSNGKVERACRTCQRARARRWWRENRGVRKW